MATAALAAKRRTRVRVIRFFSRLRTQKVREDGLSDIPLPKPSRCTMEPLLEYEEEERQGQTRAQAGQE